MIDTQDSRSIQEAARIYAQLVSDIDKMRMELEEFEKEKVKLAAAGDVKKMRAEVDAIKEETKAAKRERDEVVKEYVARSNKVSGEASLKIAEANAKIKEVQETEVNAKEALNKLDKAQRELEGSKAYVKDQLRVLDARTVSVHEMEIAVSTGEKKLKERGNDLKALEQKIESDKVSNEKASDLLKEMEKKAKDADKVNAASASALVSATKSNEASVRQMQKESKELQIFYRLAKEARGVLEEGEACESVKRKVDMAFPKVTESGKA